MKTGIGTIVRRVIPQTPYLLIREHLLKPKFKQIKSEKIEKNQIVVIGDSHSRFFSGATPETEIMIHIDKNGCINFNKGSDTRFCSFRLGPALAYNLNREGTSIKALEKYMWLSQNLLGGG